MPNHFVCVGLCARGDKERIDLSPLTSQNLCEVVLPLPKDLIGIVSTNPLCRFRNKQTGEFSTSCNGQHGDDWERVTLSDDEVVSLREKHGAASWYEWQLQNWGTKWGTYELTVTELDTDGSPVIIKFETAWTPPNQRTMRLMSDYLRDNYDLHHILWTGHDPSNGTTRLIAAACE